MRKKKNLQQLLNLNYLNFTNKTYYCGRYDLPYIKCPSIIDIDYLALYSERRNYNKTSKTCICFYQYDINFDTMNGVFNAIYYNKVNLLSKYKERFKNVRYAIAPDYSEIGDIPTIENVYRLFKSRVVSVWLCLECKIIVIPNITYASKKYFDVMLDGMEDTEVVAFNVKGCLKSCEEKTLLLEAIKYTVDNLKQLKKIIVYSVAINDDKVRDLFKYAIINEIEVVIPNNLLKKRNIELMEVDLYGQN